jgi:hypothetical protein
VRLGRLAWAIPGGLLAGAVGTRIALAFAPASIAADLAQPFPIVTAWHAYGALHLGMLFGAIAIGGAAYVLLLRAFACGQEPLSLAAVVACAAGGLIAAFAWPLAFSSDVYAYAAYGDLAAHGANPYAHVAIAPGDATLRAALWQWGGAIPACVYGPFFVEIARLATTGFASFGTTAQLAALRALACAALLACGPLAYAAFATRARSQRLFAAAAIALNPLALWSAAEGHNDAIALAVALAGFVAARRYGALAGGLIATLSVGIKAPGAIAAFGVAIAHRMQGRAFASALAGILAGGALVAIAYLPYLGGIVAGGTHGPYAPAVSLQAICPPLGIALAIGALGFAVRALFRGDSNGWPLAALGLWLAIPNPQPWYGLWFLPIAALAPRSIAAWVLVGLSLTTILRYVPDAVAPPGYPLDLALSLVAFAPLLLLWLHFRSKH